MTINVIQETQADEALIEVAEEIFREHNIIQSQEPNKETKELRGTDKDGNTKPTDKVVHFGELNDRQNHCPRKTFFLFSCFQENAGKSKKILNISLTKNSEELAINLRYSNSASRMTKSGQFSKMENSWEP